jgi:hypothetical protein
MEMDQYVMGNPMDWEARLVLADEREQHGDTEGAILHRQIAQKDKRRQEMWDHYLKTGWLDPEYRKLY